MPVFVPSCQISTDWSVFDGSFAEPEFVTVTATCTFAIEPSVLVVFHAAEEIAVMPPCCAATAGTAAPAATSAERRAMRIMLCLFPVNTGWETATPLKAS